MNTWKNRLVGLPKRTVVVNKAPSSRLVEGDIISCPQCAKKLMSVIRPPCAGERKASHFLKKIEFEPNSLGRPHCPECDIPFFVKGQGFHTERGWFL